MFNFAFAISVAKHVKLGNWITLNVRPLPGYRYAFAVLRHCEKSKPVEALHRLPINPHIAQPTVSYTASMGLNSVNST